MNITSRLGNNNNNNKIKNINIKKLRIMFIHEALLLIEVL